MGSLRATKAAPTDEILYPQPVTYQDKHMWIGQAGVMQLPLYRIIGLRARANGVVTTLPFAWPVNSSLWLNVDAHWYGTNGTTLAEKQIGCNEGCAAYVMAEVLDATTGHVIPGYEHSRKVYQDVDDVRLQLDWPAQNTQEAPSIPSAISPGRAVQLRVYFRDATIYAIGEGKGESRPTS